MSLAMWSAILISGVFGGALALYFVWPDVSKRTDDEGAR